MGGYDYLDLTLAWLVTAVAGALQGTIGFGFGVLSVPILTLVDPRLTPVPQVLAAFPMTLYMAWREHSHLSLPGSGLVVAGRIPGAAVGAGLLAVAGRTLLDGVIAMVVLGVVLVMASGLTVPRTPATSLAAGLFSGITSTVAAIGGPPVALLYHEDRGGVVRSNLAAIFAFGIVISISALVAAGVVTGHHVRTALLLLPALVIGLYASRFLAPRAEGRPLRIGILSVAAVAALTLGVRSLWGG